MYERDVGMPQMVGIGEYCRGYEGKYLGDSRGWLATGGGVCCPEHIKVVIGVAILNIGISMGCALGIIIGSGMEER